jgi:UDP-N-acetyl-D-mannosaminuronic acid dehydrogenase
MDRVVVVGGCGHVGLPLGVSLAVAGVQTVAYDIDESAIATVGAGRMPFEEPGAQVALEKVLSDGTFEVTGRPEAIASADAVIVVVGTPIDEHLNPDAHAVPRAVAGLGRHLRDGQLLILRSTVFPGVTRMVERTLQEVGVDVDLAFCPERIAEGKAMVELRELPQIVSGCTPRAVERASVLFGHLTNDIVVLSPEEAELAKLFTNTWRYIRFAAANQLFMIANDYGLDYECIRSAIAHNYPRAADLPKAGFTAGPCLFKDTMQLAAFNNNNFTLGHASMVINEGLPLYVVARISARFNLATSTVGILGMAFKAESDDIRSSLSYKLRRILRAKAANVLCSDPYVRADPSLVSLEQVLEESHLLVIGAPHEVYRALAPVQPVVDIWNLAGNGVRL